MINFANNFLSNKFMPKALSYSVNINLTYLVMVHHFSPTSLNLFIPIAKMFPLKSY